MVERPKHVLEDVMEALENMTRDDWDRLRWKIWQHLCKYLREISDADDLVHSAVVGLLEGKRKWPHGQSVSDCLYNIALSNRSHEWAKEKRQTSINDMPEPSAENFHNNVESPIRGQIVEWLADDPILRQIIEYKFGDPDANAKEIASALGIREKDIYNANRRLKDRLNRMKNKEDETV